MPVWLVLFFLCSGLNALVPTSEPNRETHPRPPLPANSPPTVRWATKVLGVSSEAIQTDQSPVYRAVQALGTPNHLPSQGPTTCAWQPSTADSGEEWIQVAFDTLMPIRQVVVAESAGAGSVYRVYLYDPQGEEHLVFDSLYAVKGDSHLFQLTLKSPTAFAVASVKIVLNTLRRPGYSQVDAVGISASSAPVELRINVSPNAPEPGKLLKENLGKGVNSKSRELNPIITPDGKTLYFTRWGHPDNLGIEKEELVDGEKVKQKTQDIWFSEFQNGTWQPSRNIGPPLNNGEHNAVCSVSADGQLFLLNQYLPNGRMREGLSQSQRTKTGWSFPRIITIKNYNLHGDESYSEYALSADRQTLIMSGQLKGTLGRKDLYVSHRVSEESWSEPFNLGPSLNTAENENSPFLGVDGRTLYFSSKGLPGFGNDDIFVTRRLDDSWTRWSSPENLGPGINTAQWDGYFSIPASGEWAYLCSVDRSIGEEDIFRLRIPDAIKPEPVAIISGSVLNFTDKKPLRADVVMSVLSGIINPTDTLRTEYNPETGEFKLVLPLQKSYGLAPVKKGYVALSETIDLTTEKRYREIRKNLYLIPLTAGQKITLNNVFFEQSKFNLLAASFAELDRLALTMRENPALEILLEGHTDNQGDFNLNLKLSIDRVDAVKKYLTEKSIPASRIQTKGWGATKPIASNLTEEMRRKNRRVEFTVLKNG